jgi:hypothetical protein
MHRDARDFEAFGAAHGEKPSTECATARCAKFALYVLLFGHALACGGSRPELEDPADAGPAVDAGIVRRTTDVKVTPPPDDEETARLLRDKLNDAKALAPAELANRYPATFVGTLGYDATAAAGMDRIQASSLRLDSRELEKLGRNGFVITDRNRFPTFTYGYRTIYADHLPLYVSADSILEAVHRSYDAILASLESNSLASSVTTLLDEMYAALAAQPADATKKDLDLYLSVARSLLAGTSQPPTAGGDVALFTKIMSAVNSASGVVEVSLFGSTRTEDFSQYVPRGHYTQSEELKRYFRAMMWLGRTDFRMLETQPDGAQHLNRRDVEAAFALVELLDERRRTSYRTVDDAIRAFVGDQDYLTVEQMAPLAQNLGIARRSDLAKLSDGELAQGLAKTTFGRQRIASHIMVNGGVTATLPLSLSFAFFGQRYVLDSHVFSQVVYDRVPKRPGVPLRMMPDPLDVAFAALGNNQALTLLAPGLERHRYSGELAVARVLADEHGSSYWRSNLYNLWMSSLRGLSPAGDLATNGPGLFTVARTEAWGRRILNAQLASWAELRHDTLLYAKQSYTGVPVCEFPDAYVDPYPSFFAAIESFAAHGRELAGRLSFPANSPLPQMLGTYFSRLGSSMRILREMAEGELAGAQITAAQLEFINQAVVLQDAGCASVIIGATGWYPALFFTNQASVERDPVIADVHTQPADEAGNLVGKILHVGTGDPRQMVVTVDTCGMPRAYVGLASAYFERITENFKRLTDEEWAKSISGAAPADVPWMTDLIVR